MYVSNSVCVWFLREIVSFFERDSGCICEIERERVCVPVFVKQRECVCVCLRDSVCVCVEGCSLGE